LIAARTAVRQRHREPQALVAVLEARAQAVGLALARLDGRAAPRGTSNRIGRSV
jgi:hypothetical protein